jgi:hypothetical protein
MHSKNELISAKLGKGKSNMSQTPKDIYDKKQNKKFGQYMVCNNRLFMSVI